MKHHLPLNNTLITPSSTVMTGISPLALSLGCALFFGAVQTVSAATTFTLSLAPLGPITALVNTNIVYTAKLTETGTTASTGTTTVKSTLPVGMAFVSGGAGTSGFTCTYAALTRLVSCIRATSIPVNTAVAIPLTLSATTTGAKSVRVNVTGGGSGTTVTSNVVNANIVTPPDLAIVLRQPTPALAAPAMSQVEVRVNNNGGTIAPAPINVTFTLPTNVSAPAKFSRIADHWVCITTGQIVSCSFDQAIAAGGNSRLRIPVTPATAAVGTKPSFIASVAPIAGETNVANNGPITLVSGTAVKAWVGAGIVDPTGTYTNLVLNPLTIPKYVLPLPNPTAAFFKHKPDPAQTTVDAYTLDIKQVTAQILPPGYPATPVFAYGDPARPDTFTYPAHTIEARSTDVANLSGAGKPVQIQYKNTGLLPVTKHLLPVDHSIHGANAGEPDIRSIAHLHGSRVIEEKSDGYPEAWSTPSGAIGAPMTTPTSLYNAAPFNYSNQQEATMLWYHDHTMGMTRLNVYAGMAGLYMLRDDNEMAMINANQLPSGPHEVPLVLQDRMFNANGSLAYPDKVVLANGTTVGSLAAPSMVPEFFGDVMVVNGVSWPYLQVEPRKYRFRILNGSNARFYTLALSGRANNGGTAPVPFQVIGAEGGFLNTPQSVTSLTLGPAERYDVIIDFSTLNGRNVTLTNSARTPFGRTVACPAANLTCVPPGVLPTAGLHDQLMQFKVNLPLSAVPLVTLPVSLRPVLVPAVATLPPLPVRKVLLGEAQDNLGRILPMSGTPDLGFKGWMEVISETPAPGSEETWEIYNTTMDAHPVHMHSSAFQIIERQAFTATLGVNGQLVAGTVALGTKKLLPSTETGWKETVIAYPSEQNNIPLSVGQTVAGEITRVRMKFDTPPPRVLGGAAGGQFVWHCHIVEHEDHDMMRPLTIQ